MRSTCDCGHPRSKHTNGVWECRWCSCKGFKEPVVPDIFDDLPDQKGGQMKFFWTLDPLTTLWGTQAEDEYPDGRYFLLPYVAEFELWGYERNEPLTRGTMEHCQAFAESMPGEPTYEHTPHPESTAFPAP